jgi:hypothetical protein
MKKYEIQLPDSNETSKLHAIGLQVGGTPGEYFLDLRFWTVDDSAVGPGGERYEDLYDISNRLRVQATFWREDCKNMQTLYVTSPFNIVIHGGSETSRARVVLTGNYRSQDDEDIWFESDSEEQIRQVCAKHGIIPADPSDAMWDLADFLESQGLKPLPPA